MVVVGIELNGLSVWDELGEEFKREAVENGKLFILFRCISGNRLLGRPEYQLLRHGHSSGVHTESPVAYDQ